MPFTDVKGIRTYYEEYGDAKNSKHVLFIHGLGGSSGDWGDIPYALSKYFHTITIDLVGFGESDKPEKAHYYTIKGFSKFIVDFLGKISGIKKDKENNNNYKISLVGYSLGGHIVTQVAIENKEVIEKLVLIASTGLIDKPNQLLKDYLSAAMEVNPVTRYEKVKRVFEDAYASPSRLLPVAVDLFDYAIERPGAKYAFQAAFHSTTTTQIEPEGFKQFEDIPCLTIWGKKGNMLPEEYYYDRFRQKLPNAKFEEIEDAGHSLIDEKSVLVYEKLRTFLS
jgi:pimeloyl-ACP methyl ester carboxylesterase